MAFSAPMPFTPLPFTKPRTMVVRGFFLLITSLAFWSFMLTLLSVKLLAGNGPTPMCFSGVFLLSFLKETVVEYALASRSLFSLRAYSAFLFLLCSVVFLVFFLFFLTSICFLFAFITPLLGMLTKDIDILNIFRSLSLTVFMRLLYYVVTSISVTTLSGSTISYLIPPPLTFTSPLLLFGRVFF